MNTVKTARLLTCGLLLSLSLSACRPFWIQTAVTPAGPPEYQLGWEDGCDTGLSAEGSWDYKIMFGFKKRPEMATNDQYKQGWNEGFSYCRFSYGASKGSGLGTLGWGEGGSVYQNESLPW